MIEPFIGDIWELALVMPALGTIFQLTWTSLYVPRSLFTSSRKVFPSCTTLIPSEMALVKLKGKQAVHHELSRNT